MYCQLTSLTVIVIMHTKSLKCKLHVHLSDLTAGSSVNWHVLLNSSFGESQEMTLEDYCMLKQVSCCNTMIDKTIFKKNFFITFLT